jgi:hypothetical protein
MPNLIERRIATMEEAAVSARPRDEKLGLNTDLQGKTAGRR